MELYCATDQFRTYHTVSKETVRNKIICDPGTKIFTIEQLSEHVKQDGFVYRVELTDDNNQNLKMNGIRVVDKFIIKDVTPIGEFELWKSNKEWCIRAVKRAWNMLMYVHQHNQTEEMIKSAVTRCGYILKYAAIKTPEICELAVKQTGIAIAFVPIQKPELCELAVSNNGTSIQYINDITPELCILAVNQATYSLKYIPTKMLTFDLCKLAISISKGTAIKYLHDASPELIKFAMIFGNNQSKV
jgi:hypothetical protein